MSLVKVKRFAQVTIPAAIRRKAHIVQGDLLDISYEGNRIVITPKRISDMNIDWARKFEEALGSVRATAKEAGITAKDIEQAVKTARRGTGP
jgi:AbrB family looped-hinge helix DNA binding protein